MILSHYLLLFFGNILLMPGLLSFQSEPIGPTSAFLSHELCSSNFVCFRHFLVRMSRSAAEILQNFYLRLRDRNTSADGTPITARQLESLVRLAEARARVDLRDEISEQDALVS